MKRIIATALLCAMLCGMIFASAFTDVDDKYVSILAEKEIAKGYGDGTFGYNDVCTREQFITFIWRASDKASAESDVSLGDVKDGAYYKDAVLWAYENGISKIYSDGSFGSGKPVDREHAAYFLYNWAKLTGRCEANTGVLLTDYTDATEISKDSVTAVAWAVSEGIIFDANSDKLNPKKTITRGEAAIALGKILDKHVCSFSDWTDNGDGTCKRTCSLDASHKESGKHVWNDGELTKAPTETTGGSITYTCINCKAQKKEAARAGSKITTRADIEEAVVAAALAYYAKNPYVQYDSTYLSDLSPYAGGTTLLSTLTPPEEATSDKNLYSVCSDYTYQSYYEGAGIEVLWDGAERPLALTTEEALRIGDNQEFTQACNAKINEPITEEDIDACISRWMNYDEYKKSFESKMPLYIGYGLFESSSFTDWTDGLVFRDDGYEGEVHYAYYDAYGNELTPNEVREKYYYPYLENKEEVMRPGDFIVTNGHDLLYIGNGRILDCSGYKVNTTTGEDKKEEFGAIQSIRIYPYPFNSKNISSVIHFRPIQFFVNDGYDSDPGNDIAKNFTIPEKTKSRIKYPMMSIDRTVDITPYGTTFNGDELTYTITIANKADMRAFHLTSGYTEDIYYDVALGLDHTKVIYNDLAVSEIIPEGCELVPDSVSDDGEFKDNKITWTLNDIKPGESQTLTYKVKVTAEAGSEIVSGGGFVDNIPSNTITNAVGQRKLSDENKAELSKLALSGADALSEFGEGTAFAENILAKSGFEAELPDATDMINELFKINPLLPETSLLINIDSHRKLINLFELRDDSQLKELLIDGFWGGRRFFAGEDKKSDYADNCMKEFRADYLQTGDIIISATAKDRSREGMALEFSMINVMLFDGEKLLSAKTIDGKTEYAIAENIEEELYKLYMTDKDLFFALRPSQANR